MRGTRYLVVLVTAVLCYAVLGAVLGAAPVALLRRTEPNARGRRRLIERDAAI